MAKNMASKLFPDLKNKSVTGKIEESGEKGRKDSTDGDVIGDVRAGERTEENGVGESVSVGVGGIVGDLKGKDKGNGNATQAAVTPTTATAATVQGKQR